MKKKENEFDNILDECLERVIRGETVEACLEGYPEHASELEPLLRTALDAREAVSITPRAEFRERASRQFQEAIREMTPPESRGFFGWFPRWVAVVSIVVIVLLAGSGVVAGANNSLPDSPLYAVKLATETVRLTFATSTLDKAELYVKLTDERVEEIIAMAERGETAYVELTTKRLDEQLRAVAELAVVAVSPVSEGDAAMFGAPNAQLETASVPEPSPTPAPEPAPLPAKAPEPEIAQIPVPETPPPVIEEPTEEAVPREAPVITAVTPDAALFLTVEGLEGPERLRVMVLLSAVENSQALQDILDTAPESVRLALQNAIEVANTGYEQVLGVLE